MRELGDIRLRQSVHTSRRAIRMFRSNEAVGVNCFTESPRHELARLVNTHQGERNLPKGSSASRMFTAMISCQLARFWHPHPSRSATASPAAWGSWCISGSPGGRANPTLSYADVHRHGAIVEDSVLVDDTLEPGSEPARRAHTRVPFQEQTAVARCPPPSLCLRLFPWATLRRTRRCQSRPTSC